MRALNMAAVALLSLMATSCTSISPVVTQAPSAPQSAYQIQKSFVLPHVLETSGRIMGDFRVEIDGVKVVERNDAPIGDLDGDGLPDMLAATVTGFVVNSHTGGFDRMAQEEPYSLTLAYRKGRPGRPVFGNITFEKLFYDPAVIEAWLKETASGKNIRKSVSIVFKDRTGQDEGRITFYDSTVKGPREAGSGMATGKREAGSGMATGRREAGSGMATGRVGAGQVTEIVTFSSAKASYQSITVNEEGVR